MHLLVHNPKEHGIHRKMDPFVVGYVGATPQQTSIAYSQGQECHWEDSLQFPIKGEQFLLLDSFDYDAIGKNDFIGRAQLDLTELLAKGPHFSNWVFLFDKEKQKVGQIYLSLDILTAGADPNMPADYRPRQGPINSILDHGFGDWARSHPGYVPQPVIASAPGQSQQPQFGGAGQSQQPNYGAPGQLGSQ